ncbi:MAG: branched-chain amino acid aminotransferase [Planctomyces sp.]|nr:branched-chain amino acid aminotransferase [Planctomyces sp.]
MNILNALKNDENGFVVSAELVLVGTICVIGMIVGLTELSYGVNEELEDLGSAIGGINQTYYFTLASGKKGEVVGSTFLDFQDECDNSCDLTCNSGARGEKGYGDNNGHYGNR